MCESQEPREHILSCTRHVCTKRQVCERRELAFVCQELCACVCVCVCARACVPECVHVLRARRCVCTESSALRACTGSSALRVHRELGVACMYRELGTESSALRACTGSSACAYRVQCAYVRGRVYIACIVCTESSACAHIELGVACVLRAQRVHIESYVCMLLCVSVCAWCVCVYRELGTCVLRAMCVYCMCVCVCSLRAICVLRACWLGIEDLVLTRACVRVRETISTCCLEYP